MSQDESSLKAAARDMEAWERRGRGEIVIGREMMEEDGNASSSGEEWGNDGGDDEEAIRRRKSGVRGQACESSRNESLLQKTTKFAHAYIAFVFSFLMVVVELLAVCSKQLCSE